MKRLIGVITLTLGLVLIMLLSLHPTSSAVEPRRPPPGTTASAPVPLQPAWDKMGSTLALMLAVEEQQMALPPRTSLGLMQADIQAAQAVQVSARFERELTMDKVSALERDFGLQFHRLDGEPSHVAAIYGVSVPLDQMGALSREPSVVQIEMLNKPVASPPLDVSIPLVGADQVWATQDWAGQDIRGQGVRIADFDTGVDVYHPDFWRADGGTYTWRDNDGGGFTGGGGECVDLNGNSACDFPGETLRYFDEGGAAGIGTPGVFEADVDWLYNDADADGQRDHGPTAGYTETQPTYGERILLVDDTNLNNALNAGENLIALGTSKVYATLNCGTVTRTRGVDLYLSDNDTNGHGTGVAGVLLGGNVVNVSGAHTVPNRRFVGAAPEAELLAVNTSCWTPIPETTYIPWAANHGADVMLYEFGGWVFEFMDGSSNMEQMIDAQATDGIVQVVPAGNLAGSGKEDTETIAAQSSHVFTANVPSFPFIIMEARYTFLWRSAGINLTFAITTPWGLTATLPSTTSPGAWGWTPLSDNHQIWYRRGNSSRGTAKYDIWVQKSWNPIDTGNWLIRADNPSGTAQTIYAYVTDNYYQWSGGIAWVNPNETKTICWPATADHDVTVGSYSTRSGFDTVSAGDLSSFSSRGSRVDGARAVDIAAPGGQFEVVAAESKSSGASTIGKYQWFGGTSAAGPHVAGVAALMLQKNPTLTPTQVISILHASAITDAWTEAVTHGGSTPNDDWGWGKVNAAGAVRNTPAPTDFWLVVTPTGRQVAAGQATTYTVGLSARFGFTSPVTLSVGGQPSTVIVSWSQNPITPGVTSALWVTTALATPPGDHTLTITGTGGGLTHTAQMTLTVLSPALSVSKATASNVVAGMPLTYTLLVSNTGNAAATSLVITDALPIEANYSRCGGGTCGETGGVVTWSGFTVPTGDNVEVTFVVTACTGSLANRTYRVARCAEGVSSSWGPPVTTTVQAPYLAAAFTPSATSVPASTTVVFTDASTTDGGPIVAWRWDFDDGGTGSGQVVSHTYAATGAYTVTLSVTDTCGYTSKVQVPDAVKVGNLVFLPLVLRN